MKFSAKNYAQVLYDCVLSTSTQDHDKVLDNFIEVLVNNNDLKLFDEIAQEFHRLELNHKNIKLAEVSSAAPLSKENEAEIIKQLNKIVGTNVELKKKIDKNLIGGVMIKVEDQLIDASVRTSLDELKKELGK